MDPTGPIQPGRSFEDLDVLEAIGKGSYATVYRAHDSRAERYVALKVLDATRFGDSARARRQILAEARMVARIHDPHVVTLYAVYEQPNDLWVFSLEYLDGGSLTDRLRRDGALDPAETRRIFAAILRGLQAAHDQGIVHHDIKPGNVLLGRNGDVKLTDFGLGRFIAEGDLNESARGRARGTPYYMSPEVTMGRAGLPASDIWSVGVVLYEMLSGRKPFPGRTPEELFLTIQNAPPAPLDDARDPALAGIAFRCLAKAAAERPASPAALLEELEQRETALGLARVDPGVAGAPAPPLVGRETEFAMLEACLDDVRPGHGRAVLVLGEAGIGKTTLVEALGREARTRGFAWVEARVSPLEGLRRPLLTALRAAVPHEDPSSLSGSGADRLRLLREDAAPLLNTPWEVEQALLALSDGRRLGVLVEDLQHCDRDELRLLAALANSLAHAPVLLALTYRTREPGASESMEGLPTGYYDLATLPEVQRLELEPLADADVRALVEQAADLHEVPGEVLERVIRDSEGVPLYALELFRHLEAAGEIERAAGGIRVTPQWGRGKLPRALRDVVTRRLQGVGEKDRALIETAAVAGAEFDGRHLAEVMGVSLLEVLRALQRLYRERALVVPLEHGYRFGHALYHEAIYQEMAPDLRRALHETWARRLEERSEGGDVDPETLGRHWERAGRPEKAAGPLALAARAAAGRGEHTRAWALAERAGVVSEAASDEDLRGHVDLLLSLASVYESEEEAKRIERLYERMHGAAAHLGDEVLEWRTVVAESWHRNFCAHCPPVDRDALLEAATRLPDGKPRGQAWWLHGMLAAGRGELADARADLERAEACFTACGATNQLADLLHPLGSVCRTEGDFERARELFARATAAHQALRGNTPHAAISLASEIVMRARCGRVEGAGRAMEEPITWLTRTGHAPRAAYVAVFQAELYEAEGLFAEARAALGRAESVLRKGVLAGAAWSLFLQKARMQILAGETAAAAASLEEAETNVAELEPVDLAQVHEPRALLLVARGDLRGAQKEILRALDVVAGTADRLNLGRLMVDVVRLIALGVDLSPALPVFDRLGASEAPLPLCLDLSVSAARTLARRNLTAADTRAVERAAACARDDRIGWRQAEMGIVGRLVSARARLLAGDPGSAAKLLLDATRRAQEIDDPWVELRALHLYRAAGLPVPTERLAAIEETLRAGGGDDVGGAIVHWIAPLLEA